MAPFFRPKPLRHTLYGGGVIEVLGFGWTTFRVLYAPPTSTYRPPRTHSSSGHVQMRLLFAQSPVPPRSSGRRRFRGTLEIAETRTSTNDPASKAGRERVEGLDEVQFTRVRPDSESLSPPGGEGSPFPPGGRKVLAQRLEFESLKTDKVYTSTAPPLYSHNTGN